MRPTVPFLALFVVIGCAEPEPRAVSATLGLPEYTPEEASFLDDLLSPAVFGLPVEVHPDQDPKLGERVKRAEAVVRVRVSTVSESSLAGTKGFTIALIIDPHPLSGLAPESPLELQLGPGSPSLGGVQAEDAAFVGRRFVLFLRRYSHHGEAELHWHGEGDTPALAGAIERSKALDEMAGKSQTRN